jgi:sugar phosphate isomerase/epimerase
MLMYSGLRYENTRQLADDLAMLNRSAEACAARGVQVLYHNHHWEFEDNGRVIDAVLTDGSPTLGLCPDVGWICKAGVDLTAFLDRAADRILPRDGRAGAVHLKDFASPEPSLDTVELGEGIVPLADVARWLDSNAGDADLWLIAEQDKSALSPAEAVTKNATYCKKTFSIA